MPASSVLVACWGEHPITRARRHGSSTYAASCTRLTQSVRQSITESLSRWATTTTTTHGIIIIITTTVVLPTSSYSA